MDIGRLFIFLLLGLSVFSCGPAAPENEQKEPEPEREAVTITVSGLPSQQVLEGSSFNLTLDSNSDAAITCSSSVDAAQARMFNRICRVTLGEVEANTPVTITFEQAATDTYQAAKAELTFTIRNYGEETPPDPVDPDPTLSGVRTVYVESMKDILNPERGLYGGASDIRSASSPVALSHVKSIRASGMSLMYVGFYLTEFIGGDISQEYLDMIQASMDAFRAGGIKCVLRFAYQNDEGAKPWDAPVDVVLRHVEQLKPLLQKNADVIFVLQAGFVGVWGEWYYTANFIMDPVSDADYQPRRRLVDALMDALPECRQVQVRTPQFKMRMYNLNWTDTLTVAKAHDGSVLSRLAGHNDCFGASADDYGTFDNESGDREFWKAESRYTIMGGETCKVSDYCNCNASMQDVEDYHWTYLNSGYNTSVLKRWQSSGCYDEIVRKLGYRLVLLDSYSTESPKAGEPFEITLRIQNRGYAAPMNPRNAMLVFVDGQGNKTEIPLDADPRTWYTGRHVVKASFTLPSDKGTLYLNLSDPLLPDRPEYSIALANENIFDPSTGYNKILELK